MTVPSADLTTVHLDASTDDPAQARSELKAAVDKINAIINDLGAGNTVWTNANDGAGSGLDSDLLDGQSGAYYQDATNINAGTLALARLATGFKSGFDSDLLDGQHGSYYQALGNATGSLPQSQVTNLVSNLGDKLEQSTDLTSGSSIGASGHFKLGNILFNVGSGTVNKNTTTSLTFDTAFTALVNVQMSPTGANQDFNCYANNLSNTGFDVTADNSSGPASTSFHYLAIGWKT